MGIYWGSLHVSRKWGQMQDYHTVKVVIGKRPEAFNVHLEHFDLWKAGKNVWTCCIWHHLTDMFNWVESTISVPTWVGPSKYRSIFLKQFGNVWNIYIKSSILEILFSIVSFRSPTKPTPLWPLTFSAFMPWICWRARRAFNHNPLLSDVESDSFGWKVTYLLQDVQWFFRNMGVEVMKNDFLLSEMVVIFGECGLIWAP